MQIKEYYLRERRMFVLQRYCDYSFLPTEFLETAQFCYLGEVAYGLPGTVFSLSLCSRLVALLMKVI